MRFDNQVALVTGAASGIGRALVQQFVAEGAAVVAVDIVEEALHRVVAELQSQGGKATGCVANISSDEDVERMLGIATSTYGRLDILCNNAGIMDLMTPAADVPRALWDRVLAVNVKEIHTGVTSAAGDLAGFSGGFSLANLNNWLAQQVSIP